MQDPSPSSGPEHPLRDYDDAVRLIRSGQRLSAETFASLLEANPDKLVPAIVHQHLVGFLRGKATLPRGPKPREGARWDFIRADMIDLYHDKLREFRNEDKAKRSRARKAGEILPRAEKSAHERAKEWVLEVMREDLGKPIGSKRFSNIMSERRLVREEDEMEPDEHDPPDHLPEPPKR